MKMLKKLALVSAVSMISAGAFAMEAMDDESMAETTGQDGITILISPATKTTAQLAALGVSATTTTAIDLLDATGAAAPDGNFKGLSISQVNIHDDDGLGNAAPGSNGTTANSGALVIGSGGADSTVVFADNATPITINLDMVGNINGGAGNAPMLNIAITTPTLAIKLGDIYVANSDASEVNFDADGVVNVSASTDGTAVAGAVKIISGFEVIMGGSTTVIQLGNEAQGAMIRANTSLIGGLTINNFELIDAGGLAATPGADAGSIKVGQLVMKDNGGANLTVDARINASAGVANPLGGEGLYITLAAFGSATGADLTLNNVTLGASASTNVLGDIQIIGLDMAGTTMIIRGH